MVLSSLLAFVSRHGAQIVEEMFALVGIGDSRAGFAGHFQVSLGLVVPTRHGVFQPKFWEHTIRNERDFERHVDYIHYNPVKHKLAQRPRDWPYSSFHRSVRLGLYPIDWGCQLNDIDASRFSFNDITVSARE